MSDTERPLSILAIHLGTDRVGDLTLLPNDVTEFRLLDGYREMTPRPVLGQTFEDDLGAVHRSRMALPPFFSNLLPEGRLRELLAGRLEVATVREFHLLARLGEDLPGNVRATLVDSLPERAGELDPIVEEPSSGPLKFSLAGVQLKLSMVREGRGMTLPVSGRGGDWIVKLPGGKFRGVPENEYATMSWARLVGITVPPVELISVSELDGLPPGLEPGTGMAFATRRFDRPEPGMRVHIEDFAQILGLFPAQKYGKTNYETIGRVILRTAGEPAFLEFVRRLAFLVVSANADAHVKNWSLIYPGGVDAQLAPAYDLVSTIEFIGQDALALNLGKSKAWDQMTLARFASFAERIGADPGTVTTLVSEVVERALDIWPTIRRDAPVSETMTTRLEQHWKLVPLVAEVAAVRR